MTNLEKFQNGTEEEIKKLCISLAYKSGNYTYQERQVEEWLNEKVKTIANDINIFYLLSKYSLVK